MLTNIKDIVKRALSEDMPWSDITVDTLFDSSINARGFLIAREPLTVSGIAAAIETFMQIDPLLKLEVLVKGGEQASAGDTIMRLEGDIRSILMGERTALNFLQRLSGIATETGRFVKAAGGRVRITDTRKTTPTLRLLEKNAVTDGGGSNHRFSLSDAVMIKDTHLSMFPSVAEAVARARRLAPHTARVEVEIDSLDNVEEAVAAGADIIMLDNMLPEEIKNGVAIINGRAISEASGNISMENIAAYAGTGVDVISVGSITHSARSVDIHMKTTQIT